MPIQVLNTNFIDFNSNGTTFYKSNAGDPTFIFVNIQSIIRISSVNNPMTFDPSLNIVSSPTISWIEEGFRIGDICSATLYSSAGVIISNWNTNVTYVDDLNCEFSTMPSWYDIASGEFIVFIAINSGGGTTPRTRDDMDILVNHALNTVQGNQFSLIDGEVSTYSFTGVKTMTVGQILTGVAVGNQSGQFIESVKLTRNADTSNGWNEHTITMEVINSGAYDEAWFNFATCLKLYVKGLWASISGEPYDRTEFILDDDANTGWFNEAHNTSVLNSSLVQGLGELDYCQTTSHTIQVDGPITDLGIGGCYISTDDAYYRNVPQSQIVSTMIVPTRPLAVNNYISAQNLSGAGYNIQVTNVSTVGTITTIEFNFIPNLAFNTFMSSASAGDRLFYLWVKCGNSNLLAFADQLTCAPPVGGPLPMVSNYGFLDHSQNVTDIVGDKLGDSADTEDDIAFYGQFRLNYNGNYTNFNAKIEAFNSLTNDSFTLQETNFSLAGLPVSGVGQIQLNETQGIVSILPTTSVKHNAILKLEPTADLFPSDYGVSIYYPFVLNWRYWLTQLNASSDFYPTQDKNWEQYDNMVDWQLRLKLSLIKDGLAYTHTNQIIDNPYNNDNDISSSIKMIRTVDNSYINIIPSGELMIIESTHIIQSGTWQQGNVWGMITIEPKESSRRWLVSTIVPFDNDTSNPLTPITGLYVLLNFVSSTEVIMTCYFDSSKIDLSNGVKITAKIKENCDRL